MGHPLKCARLTVPMDYHRPLNESAGNPEVHIALVLSPGPRRTDDPASYGESPLLTNPGGPGGSGVLFAASAAPKLRELTGGDRDILGFDPRGVGATTPKANCFETSGSPSISDRNLAYMNRATWVVSGHDVGLVNSSNIALAKNHVRARAMSQLCKLVSDTHEDSIFEHLSTPNVARDMLSIIEAWDEWRLGSSLDIKTAKAGHHPEDSDPSSQVHQMNSSRGFVQSTKGKLVYWGFSYGTLLGATFASMFPDKVGRLILDGVVDADNYVTPIWQESTIDADKTLGKFFEYCQEAGPQCHLFRSGDKPKDIEDRFHKVMLSLQDDPKIVFYPGLNLPIILTASDVKSFIYVGLYSPRAAFPLIAVLLNTILTDGPLYDFIVFPLPKLGSLCGDVSLPLWPDDAQQAVVCSDKRYKLNDTIPELQERFEGLASFSSFADIWLTLMMMCDGWDVESKDPPMPWDVHSAHKSKPTITDFPILFLSNQLDPVTPLGGALNMTRKFVNASIVEQKSPGHCTLACFSPCTVKHIRAYLNEGKVPPTPKFDGPDSGEWAACECQLHPWEPPQRINQNWDGNQAQIPIGHIDGYTVEEATWMRSWDGLRDEVMEVLMDGVLGQRHVLRDAMVGSRRESFKDQQQHQYK
ncbi:TAP-like protein-domain-containing protein [Xylariales sp. AK1849]|nr:TAP-like protein-domain-containing protein [Xylariales sp. AK1849]